MKPDLSGGSSDFLIGAYIGDGQDNTNVDHLPIQPDFVAVKRVAATFGAWRTSNQSGDQSLFFSETALGADAIQSFLATGFQKGTASTVNTAGSTYHYFAFKDGTRFSHGTYTGTGASQNVTLAGFQPDLLWLKKTTGGTARGGLMRTSAQSGNAAQPFLNLATVSNAITNLLSNGFTVNTDTGANENTFAYQYAAWDAKRYAQQAYRFFANANSTDVGAVLAAQDTAAVLNAAGDAFRLRMLVRNDNANLFASGQNFKLQFVDKGAGSCASPSGGTPAGYTDVTGATVIAYNNNASVADGVSLTANANDPTDGGRTIVNHTYEEANNATNVQAAINKGQDGKWDFALVDNAANADTTYCFRLVRSDSTVLDTYTAYPEITTADSSPVYSVSITSSGVIEYGYVGLGAASSTVNNGYTQTAENDGNAAERLAIYLRQF